MECWLYEILLSQCDDKSRKFLESHKKDIRFTSFDGFEVKNVILNTEKPINIRRISNIKIGAA